MKHILALFALLFLGGAGEAATIQAKFVGIVPVKANQIAAGSRVYITVNSTGLPASLYQDNGTTVIANPMTADAYGVYQFMTATGVYDIAITHPDGTVATLTKMVIGLDASLIPWATPGTIGSTTPNSGAFTTLTATTPIAATSGGTGYASYAIGDLLYASTTTALSKLAGVATGNALISGGVTTAPSWGKIALTTHVSGTLPVGNGGTNSATALSGYGVMYSNGSAVVQGPAGTSTTILHGAAAGAPTYSAVSLTADVTGITPSANGGTGVNNAGTITNASNTTITGGGTIALGGFTATVPATGTVAELGQNNVFTANQTMGDVNWVLGTATGTKHGTATNQKQSWWNSTPIVQPSGDILTALTNTGLVASPTYTTMTGFVDQYPMMLEVPTAKLYTLISYSEVAFTINRLRTQTVSGTVTVAVAINGTPVTGLSAVAVTSTPATTNATAANTVAVGDAVTITCSSISSTVDLSLNLKGTR